LPLAASDAKGMADAFRMIHTITSPVFRVVVSCATLRCL
jgi:hypothetical protein